jgi:hypothetical protein
MLHQRSATERAVPGARGVGEEGGAAQGGGSTVRGPVDRGRPRRAGPAGPRRDRRANAGVGAALERQGQNQFSLPALTGIFLQNLNCSA